MNTTTLPAPATPRGLRAKRTLAKGIAHITSEKFSTAAVVMAAIVGYCAAISGDSAMTAASALAFIAGFTPWSLRASLRHSNRQAKKGGEL